MSIIRFGPEGERREPASLRAPLIDHHDFPDRDAFWRFLADEQLWPHLVIARHWDVDPAAVRKGLARARAAAPRSSRLSADERAALLAELADDPYLRPGDLEATRAYLEGLDP